MNDNKKNDKNNCLDNSDASNKLVFHTNGRTRKNTMTGIYNVHAFIVLNKRFILSLFGTNVIHFQKLSHIDYHELTAFHTRKGIISLTIMHFYEKKHADNYDDNIFLYL